ncbi:MAG: flippase [Nanoarchaeota archaeon]|nr:flippase [Nanoarchaeota archaeon]
MDQNDEKLNADLKLVVKSSIIVFLGIFLSKALTYIYRIIIAREFGPEIYGLFTLALMISGFFIMFSSLGLSDGLLRYMSFYRGKKDMKKAKYLFKTSLLISIISGIIFAVLLFFLAEIIAIQIFHNDQLIIFLKFFSIIIPLTVVSSILLSSFLAFEKIFLNSFINNFLQNFIKVILLILFLYLNLGVNSIMLSYTISIFAMLVVAYFLSRKYLPILFYNYKINENMKITLIKDIFSYSWPLIFVGAVYTIFGWTDSFVIGYFLDAVQVGFYNVAFTLISLFGIAPEIFKQIFFPLIMKEYSNKNKDRIKELSKQVAKWIFVINLPLFIFIFIFPGAFLNIIFGAQYLVAENTLRILAIGGLLTSLGTLLSNLLSMKGKTKIILINLIVVSLIDLLMNIILVPKYGINGAALSTIFNMALLNILLFIEVKYYTSIIPLRRKMLSIFLASIIPLICLTLIRSYISPTLLNIILLGIFFIFIYIILLFLFRCLDSHDLIVLKSIKNKLLKR